MRHLRSILYALVLAPTVWILSGVGFTQNLTGRARDAGVPETTTAALLLLLAGAAYGILLLAPLSPTGPTLAGLVFLGVGVWALVEPDSYAGGWPPGLTKEGFDLSRPGYALATLLAVPLLCTALSARRWSRYEPVELPLIGTIGRARGAAPVAGTPVASERTTVISTADPTEALPPGPALAPGPARPAAAGPAVRQAFPPGGHEPPTEALPTQPMPLGADGDEPTTMLRIPADEPTTVLTTAPDAASEQPTTPLPEATGTSTDEPTAPQPTATEDHDRAETTGDGEPTTNPPESPGQSESPEPVDEAPTADQPTEPLDPPTADIPQPTDTDEATAEVAASAADRTATSTGDAVADEAGAVPADGDEETGQRTEAVEPPTADLHGDEPTTTLLSPADAGDDEEKTQVLHLPVARTGDEPTDRLDPGGTTRVIGPGERTEVIFRRDPAEQAVAAQAARDRAAQERARQAFRDRAAQERARQAFAERAAQQAREHGEQTQVIDLAAARNRNADGDTTQVNRATVEPPDEHTEVLRFPTPGENTTERQQTPSSPDTGRADPAPQDDTTTEVAPRPRSVLDLERPADEREAETQPAIPTPRNPQDDEAEEPTHRL